MDTTRNFSTAIQYIDRECKAKGMYNLVGSVPASLDRAFFFNEEDLINALLALGITKFQRADCSWYKSEVK